MIDFDFSRYCTGCSACADSCPKKCISFCIDKNDNTIPAVDKTKCIDCHRCETICPHLNPLSPNRDERRVFLAFNKNEAERKHGSSGAVMLLLAKKILAQGGVVYGAEFTEHVRLKHTRATTYEQVLRQSKSKYVQSDSVGVYGSVKKDLIAGLKVLFVGTPCQTQALTNYLDRKYDNLLLVDFICHGVPPRPLFEKAISKYEKDNKCTVTDFSFREKTPESLRSFKIWYKKQGKECTYTGSEFDFPYYNGFLKYITFRKSCYNCKFSNPNRVSDITIGDAWGIEYKNVVNDFAKGYSLLYTNTSKGTGALNTILDELEYKEYPLDHPYTDNFSYKNQAESSSSHKRYYFLYPFMTYNQIEQWFFANSKRYNIIQKIYYLTPYYVKALPRKMREVCNRLKM